MKEKQATSLLIVLMIAVLAGCSSNIDENKEAPAAPVPDSEKPASGQEDTVLLVTGEWAPLTSEKIEDMGFFTAIVGSVFEEMGVNYTIKFYPWNRCEMLVEEGVAFAAFPYTMTEERTEKYWFSSPIYNVQTRMFYYNRSKTDFKFASAVFSALSSTVYFISKFLGAPAAAARSSKVPMRP